jgi:hypothetical protein
MNVHQALEIFGLELELDVIQRVQSGVDAHKVEQDVRAFCAKRYRELVMEAHPDRGGSHERMVELEEAIAAVRELEIRIRPPAPEPVFTIIFGTFDFPLGGITQFADATFTGAPTNTTSTFSPW